MTPELQFDAEGVARITVTGDAGLQDMIDVLELVYADERFLRPPTRLLCDALAGRAVLTGAEVHELVRHVLKHRPEGRGRVALLVGDKVSFGLGRMFELLTDDSPMEVRVFHDRGAADSWLRESF